MKSFVGGGVVRCWSLLAFALRFCLPVSHAAGSLDTSFRPRISYERYAYGLTALVALTNGQMVIAGDFRTINGIRRNAVARLNADGSLDASFDARLSGNSIVEQVTRFSNGDWLLVGTSLTPEAPRGAIARVDSHGSLRAIRQTGDAMILAVAIQADDTILVGGSYLMRWKSDLSVDPTFAPPPAFRYVRALRVQPDGMILVGGDQNGTNFQLRAGLARFRPDGTLDEKFSADFGDCHPGVEAIELQSDGKIVVAASTGIYRLHASGSLDATFIGETNCQTYYGCSYSCKSLLAIQSDGKVISGITRFNQDGSRDASYHIGNGPENREGIRALAIKPDGKILYGGRFQSWQGVPQANLVQLLDGRVPAPGQIQFAWPRDYTDLLITNVVTEHYRAGRITIVRTDGDSGVVSADWSITGGSATPGADLS